MKARFTFLGTGASMGVPVIGCTCAICHSESSYNRRTRSSALIRVEEKTFLIDAGPDFRQQALRSDLTHVDGVLLTHSHFDHIGGVDDLRVYYFIQHRPLPCLLSQETYDELKMRCHYLFLPLESGRAISAQLDFQILKQDFGAINFEGLNLQYTSYFQATTKVTGFRIGNLAYISDIREYDEKLVQALQGVDILVLSALRHVPTVMHFSVDEAIAFAKNIGAKHTWLTHIAHDLDYEETNAHLPSNVRLSYDGLEFEFETHPL